MTNEEKKLLLKDLCARLPYGVKCEAIDRDARFLIDGKYEYGYEQVKNIGILCNIESTTDGKLFGLKDRQYTPSKKYYISPALYKIDDIRPYLRPISSMTEEEARTIFELYEYKTKDILQLKITDEYLEAKIDDGFGSFERDVIWYDDIVNSTQVFDWLNAHHFDYRGLIEKGLALEAPEEMYNN